MGQIFISYIEEEKEVAEDIARKLEANGYSIYAYTLMSLPGDDYLDVVANEIKSCDAVLVLISPQSIGSYQVVDEVKWARQRRKRLLPVLYHMSWSDFERDPPNWAMALGTTTGVAIPEGKVEAILGPVLGGLKNLGVVPTTPIEAKEPEPVRPPIVRKAVLTSTLPPVGPLIAPKIQISHPLSEDDWELLISLIRRREVIPVIGPDVIRVPTGDRTVTYDQYIAEQMAQRPEYAITDADLAEQDVTREQATLNDVLSVCVKKRPSRWPINIHAQVWDIVDNAQLPVPPALTQLAQITDFDLYVTTTFDPMLELALQRQGQCEYMSYGGSRDDDVENLRAAQDQMRRQLYYLFGKAKKGSYDFAICDVETLRLLIRLHEAKYRPKRLFGELKEKHLLLLGVTFRDWFSRSFLWLVKDRGSTILPNRSLLEFFVVPPGRCLDQSLGLFLKYFSDTTRVVGMEPDGFVAELFQRWSGGARAVAPTVPKPPLEMPKGAVFLSYSRTDMASVEALYATLTRAGIPAWYDAGLGAGDLWTEKVRTYIENCSVFLPIISTEALRRERAAFRAEWRQAVELEEKWFGTGRTMLVPIVVDEDDRILNFPQAGLPEEFTHVQMYHCPGGKAGDRLIDPLRVLVSANSES